MSRTSSTTTTGSTRRTRWSGRRRVVIAAVACLLALTGCSASAGSTASTDEYVQGQDAQTGNPDAAAGKAKDLAGDRSVPDSAAQQGRDMVRTATLEVRVDRVDDRAKAVIGMVEKLGGRVDGDTRTATGSTRRATLVLRVAPNALDALIEQVSALGTETGRTVVGQDVTQVRVDLDARLASLQASVTRLQTLLAGSGSLDDLLALENALTQRISDLESLQAQRAALGDQISLASLTVRLSAPDAATPATGPDGFGSALADGWHGFALAWRWTLAVLGYALPFLAVTLLVVVPVIGSARRRRAARRTEPDAAPAVEPVPAE